MCPIYLLLAIYAGFATSGVGCGDVLASVQATLEEFIENPQHDDVIMAQHAVRGIRSHRGSSAFRVNIPALISLAVALAMTIMMLRCYRTLGSGQNLRSKTRRLAVGGDREDEELICKVSQRRQVRRGECEYLWYQIMKSPTLSLPYVSMASLS